MKKLRYYLLMYGKSLRLVWQTSRAIVFSMLFVIPLQALLPSLTIYITNLLVNSVTKSSSVSISLLLLLWGVAFFLANISTPLLVMLQGKLTDLLTYRLNYKLMKKSEALDDISYFENSQFYNDIQLLSSESSWRPVNLIIFGTSLISNLLMFLSVLLVLSSINPFISFLLILVLIPQGIIAYKIQQQAFETLVSNSEESRKLDYYSQILLSRQHIKDVRLYNLYSFFIAKYTDVFKTITGKVQVDRKKKFIHSVFFLSLSSFVIIAVFIYLMTQVNSNRLTIGVIFLFSSSIIYAVNSMSRLIEDSSLLYDTLLYMDKFFTFIAIEEKERAYRQDVNVAKEEMITFKNVSFSYPQASQLVLENINFAVSKGEKIAIVGENGAGKTTLVKLLCAFYSEYDGEINVFGKSLAHCNLLDYRKKITSIFQDFSRFDMSLRENIALSDLSRIAYDKDILDALEKGRFNKGKDSSLEQVLGKYFEGGTELSGGEWQKIALSRAFFSNAPILILDEPTASIDAKAEYELFQDFLQLTSGKTVFFITHRLASVKLSDKVLVLKSGKVHAFASHEELVQSNEYYRSLYTMQKSLYNHSCDK